MEWKRSPFPEGTTSCSEKHPHCAGAERDGREGRPFLKAPPQLREPLSGKESSKVPMPCPHGHVSLRRRQTSSSDTLALPAPSWLKPISTVERLRRPWDSSGKSTGVRCHFLLQCMKVKSESEVSQSCPTPTDPMDCSPPGSSVHGIFQARVLEWGAIAFSSPRSLGG